jgi:hypothetical protein
MYRYIIKKQGDGGKAQTNENINIYSRPRLFKL